MVNDMSFDRLPTVYIAVLVTIRDIYLTALNGFSTFVRNVVYIVRGIWLIRLSILSRGFGCDRPYKLSSSIPYIYIYIYIYKTI